MMNSVRQKRWDHLIAILLCLYLVFTTFAYYFFYAFTGNGYGRWFIILVPEIILYGCWAFDDRQKQPKYFMIPNSMSIIIISAGLEIPSAIFTESFLSFIGLGVDAPMPSLGSLANEGRTYLTSTPPHVPRSHRRARR